MIQRIPPEEKTAKREPPKVPIDLLMIHQMRRRRQMLNALREWNETRHQNQDEPVCEVQT